LEQALEKLNLGISTWVTITGDEYDNGFYWSRDLGYAKVNGTWGIALRTLDGHHANDEGDKIEEWLFNDAPRWLRVEGVGKFPELLEKLTKQADDFAEKIRKKAAEAGELVSVIRLASAGSQPSKNQLPTIPISALDAKLPTTPPSARKSTAADASLPTTPPTARK
jgi:hypothetical protein